MEHERCREEVHPRPHPQEPALFTQVHLLDLSHSLLFYEMRISHWMDPMNDVSWEASGDHRQQRTRVWLVA